MQYFILPLNKSKYYLEYIFKALYILVILEAHIPLTAMLLSLRPQFSTAIAELALVGKYHAPCDKQQLL